MAQIHASESTGNVPSTRNVRDVSRVIAYLDPEAGPITSFITKGAKRKKVAHNSKFEWNEKTLNPTADQVSGAATTGDTAITVDNAAYFAANDLVRVVPSGEVLRVSAFSTGNNTITVSRAVGSTTAATIADNADLVIIGSAWGEGASAGTPRSHTESTPFNYTQIIRRQFGETRTQANTDTYIDGEGNGRTRIRKEEAVYFKLDMERTFLFGERNKDVTNVNSPVNYTGGLKYWASSNSLNAGGTLTEAEIEDWLEDVFQNTASGDTRLLLASPKVISVLDQIAAGRLQTTSADDTYGIAPKTWVTGHGNLLIVKHRLLVDGTGGAGYSGYAFAIDPDKFVYRYLNNSDTMLNKDIHLPGDDVWKDEYLAEVGLEVHNVQTMGVLSGVTG